MKKIINKILVNHSLIYKLLLYIGCIVLVVYLFPKGGQFKYEFQKGKPWQYENYYAPFDFAIQKSDEELEAERTTIRTSAKVYYVYDEAVVTEVRAEIEDRMIAEFVRHETDKIVQDTLKARIESLLLEIYGVGFVENRNGEGARCAVFE